MVIKVAKNKLSKEKYWKGKHPGQGVQRIKIGQGSHYDKASYTMISGTVTDDGSVSFDVVNWKMFIAVKCTIYTYHIFHCYYCYRFVFILILNYHETCR